ncbi:MerR family transcriptional regulator [Yersinia enterocolitica]|uniref:MerR family transcriptional regulator n=2 Tax=Yersinia proxima TaxID=2890316 RepID=A0ABW9ETD4_9GAMM|nr:MULTISPECIES: MerR family transcriptional regulator [Yersinia]CNK99020.1 putative regulatory protein [Yersinia intermedia]EKN3571571.1 MerR family transcriptional regulator [Yersinia enterocolitica]EKN4744424.1 MerR family transcriptional regulator [Yersinia enterocolitica]EKN4840813.1 MerR family transcriptional regulator [Yersinia enterocolitica]EKN6271380.1 MerR family transcriptional regulator [Yersinia enterocolitica]
MNYTIKKFQEITRISSHNLRYFDKIGLLVPKRDANGYRLYSHAQISQAHMIEILQEARMPNAEIKAVLSDYSSSESIDKIKKAHSELLAYQEKLAQASHFLQKHIQCLDAISTTKENINTPFIEDRAKVEVGILQLQTGNILDFFKKIGDMTEDYSWYLTSNYGFLLKSSDIKPDNYPLATLFCDHPAIIRQSPYTLHAGKFVSMCCAGSLENNVNVMKLKQYALDCGYRLTGDIIIENISGPVIEKKKSDFLIKIMVAIQSDK